MPLLNRDHALTAGVRRERPAAEHSSYFDLKK
jgi:hypothetical protein